jgi:hypothetical protein
MKNVIKFTQFFWLQSIRSLCRFEIATLTHRFDWILLWNDQLSFFINSFFYRSVMRFLHHSIKWYFNFSIATEWKNIEFSCWSLLSRREDDVIISFNSNLHHKLVKAAELIENWLGKKSWNPLVSLSLLDSNKIECRAKTVSRLAVKLLRVLDIIWDFSVTRFTRSVNFFCC